MFPASLPSVAQKHTWGLMAVREGEVPLYLRAHFARCVLHIVFISMPVKPIPLGGGRTYHSQLLHRNFMPMPLKNAKIKTKLCVCAAVGLGLVD